MLESILNIDHLSEAEIIDYYSLSDSDIGLPPTKRGNPPLRNKYSKNS